MLILYYLLALFVLFSRFTISAPTGTGVISLFTFPISIIVFLFVCYKQNFGRQWVLGITLFLVAVVYNQSNFLSVGLVVLALLIHLLIQHYAISDYLDNINEYTFKIMIVFLIILFFDVFGLIDFSIWSSSKAELGFPRLRMFSDEASYFGLLMATFLAISNSKFQRGIYAVFFILSQSYYAAIYFVLVLLRKKIVIAYAAAFCAASIILPLLFVDTNVFFSNSGYIRLIGVSLISKMNFFDLLIGSGIGSGDDALTNLFQGHGVDSGSGFLFTWFYDVGFLGFVGYYLCICKSKFDVLLLSLLLLNFGAASFYIAFAFAIARHYQEKDKSEVH